MTSTLKRAAVVDGVNFNVFLYKMLDTYYLHTYNLDYGFIFEGEEFNTIDNSAYENLKALFLDKSKEMILTLSEDGRTLTADFGQHNKFKMTDDVYPSGISIKQVINDLKLNSLEELKEAYIQLANDYNEFRTDYIGR